MASFSPENVAAEKVDAMKKFEGKRYFWKFLPVTEALFVVLLLLPWLTPPLRAGEYLRQIFSGGLTRGIFVFGLVNVLIALIFSLSKQEKIIQPDLYVQYVSSSAAGLVGGFSSSSIVSEPWVSDKEERTSERKPESDLISVTLENTDTTLSAGEARPMRREMVRAVSSVAETAQARRKREMTFMPSAATESTTATDHHIYRRSRSERLNVREDFRQSMRLLCDIDDLSSDEFRSTVETFIAGKKRMSSKEWMKP